MIMTRTEIEKVLKNSIVNVTFTKTDGSVRKMKCTLIEEFLPPVFLDNDEQMEKKTRKQSLDSLAVWDMDKNAWRSFRVDSVTKMELEI
jgi:hypothetical protein